MPSIWSWISGPWGGGFQRLQARFAASCGISSEKQFMWKTLEKSERGASALEWGLVCGLIVVGAIVAIALIGPQVSDLWTDTDVAIPAAVLE